MSGLRWQELTAPGTGAVRVLRLEGPGALARLARLAGDRCFPSGSFTLVGLRDRTGSTIDEALVRAHDADAVEVHVHGAPAVVARLLAELGTPPPIPPGTGLEARAEARLGEARSESAARVLLDQAEGALRRAFEALLALPAQERVARAREIAHQGRIGEALVVPRRVVLVGPVNAGKSTLFNALVGRERVVVDAAEGTTRDGVREYVLLGAYPVELWDTAGRRALRAADLEAALEHEGQRLARDLAAEADLVLELVPPGATLPGTGPRVRALASRADEGPPAPGLPSLSARADPHGARALVERLFHETLALPLDPWRAGAAVSFEREWNSVLASASGRELATELERWLATR